MNGAWLTGFAIGVIVGFGLGTGLIAWLVERARRPRGD